MDEELKKRLAESAKGLLDWAQQGGAFVKEQAPLYVQELLEWEFAWAVCQASLSVLFLVAMLFAFRWCKGWAGGVMKDRDSEEPHILGAVMVSLFVAIGTIAACVMQFEVTVPAISRAIKVKVAPRVVIVEKLQGLLK